MNQRLCNSCFKNHHVDQCCSENLWRSKICGKRFNPLLCDGFMNQSISKDETLQIVGTGQIDFVAFQMVNGNQSVKTYAYLDNGGCHSLFLKSTAKMHGLNLDIKQVKHLYVGTTSPKKLIALRFCFCIKSIERSVDPVKREDVMAETEMNKSAVNVAQINVLSKNHDHLSHNIFFLNSKGIMSQLL